MSNKSTDTKIILETGSPLHICAINADTIEIQNPAYIHSLTRKEVTGNSNKMAPMIFAVTSSILK